MSTLAFALAATIKHDGHGGVADLLATPTEAVAWLAGHQDLVTEVLGRPLFGPGAAAISGTKFAAGGEFLPETPGVGMDEAQWRGLVEIRRAVRALFARAVAPGAPSKADADRLMDADVAVRAVNRAAERLGARELEWPADEAPVLRWAGRTDDLIAAVGRSAIDFLTGPDQKRLRACPAARCVKYFLQDDPRQMWCSASCGNRERVNRHYRKRHAG
ncbi:CGNR zinc finger protein [Kribbella rubisoli]|uniref:CGNR zinc finger protein n=1 Tax=Kribbella rubisoli TaxID=3075929 RepID=A0A4Q7X6S8_9ACTN|nr:ABATE domain-containing protein [Kribbella rubisoli]RZU18771.1 CGNR zinc finger protein [Kribbella rubisoli]